MAPIIGCKARKSRLKAMTLIELLVVVTIVAILASFAYPTYQAQVITSSRTLALSDLSRIQLYLENEYKGGYSSPRDAIMSGGNCQLCQSNHNEYLITISISSNGYSISADPLGKQENDICLNSINDIITLDHSGQGRPEACWK
ncbi:prepilin-type N-terminal cleavage/methylation domain-containing protein [Vibrio kasasachensis]|uniref:type IV pilin protein n=1 Tax=Vibrio kasasachensis TaxID=2910248 RepID=UPI003D0ADB01